MDHEILTHLDSVSASILLNDNVNFSFNFNEIFRIFRLLPEEVTNLFRTSFKPDVDPGFFESSQETTTVPKQESPTVSYMNGTKSM